MSEPWVAWVMLLLIVLLVLANYSQKGFIIDGFRSITTAKDRDSIFSEVARTTSGEICMFIYQIGIVAMGLYALLFTQEQETFSPLNYLIIIGIVFGYVVIKYLLERLFTYVFLDKKAFNAILMQYSNLYIVVCTILYPIVLLILFAPFITHTATMIMLGILAGLTVLIWIWKAFRLFFNNIISGLYIFLYLCTLEIIPIVGIILVIKNFVL